MIRRALPEGLLFLALLLVLLVPFLLQPARERAAGDARRLVIVSPHNEAVRFEFERAFRRWHAERHGADVALDWRSIGGTSEIARYLDGAFAAADRAGKPGIGIDLFFGGGQYDHARQAARGRLAPSALRERHPAWFDEAILPARYSGEQFYDPGGVWIGCCLSSFGICWNTQVFADQGLGPAPRRWEDLADGRLFGRVALADPTKSGSINKAFEMLVQEQMRAELAARGADPETAAPEDLAAGWRRACRLIRRIAANACYFTDAASKVPMDVAQGAAAAGMCIDFYGRFESERVERHEGSTRLRYRTPAGGSSVSVDPISLLRGAPHRATAEHFIEFCLSPQGQRLWNARPGTPGGPERYALRRLPVRRDLYTAAERRAMSDPDARPYEQAAGFVYRGAWTAPLFSLLRVLIRAMCIEPHAELAEAWEAIRRRGGPESCPDAAAALEALPPSAEYPAARAVTAASLTNALVEARLAREWTAFFRTQYRRARELALAPPP